MQSLRLRATKLAGRQGGAISRQQLLGLGFSSDQILTLSAQRALYALYPGIYAWGRPDLPLRGRLAAALLHAAPGAALDGLSLLNWRGILDDEPILIEVATPRRVHAYPGLRIVTCDTASRELHRGLPGLPVPLAFLRVAPRHTVNQLRHLLAKADYHRQLDFEAFEAISGRRGAAKLRQALERHQPALAGTRSRVERLAVYLVEEFQLPMPEVNGRIGGMHVDLVWREQKVAVEVDGYGNHRSRAQLDADHRRDLFLRSQGWTILRYSEDQLKYDPEFVAADIARALASRTAA